MTPDQNMTFEAQCARLFHIPRRHHHEGLRPHHAGKSRYGSDAECKNQIGGARAGKGDQHQGQQQIGEGGDDVCRAADQFIQRPFQQTGQQTEQAADAHRHGHRREAYQQRITAAVNNARQHVAPQLVGAQPVFSGGRQLCIDRIGIQRIVMGKPRGENHRQHHQKEIQHRQHITGGITACKPQRGNRLAHEFSSPSVSRRRGSMNK